MLKHPDRDLAALQGGDALSGCTRGGNSSQGRNALRYRGASDCLLVKPRILSLRSIDNELNAVTFDQVNHIRAAFLYLVHTFHRQTGALQNCGGTMGGDDVKSKLGEAPSQ